MEATFTLDDERGWLRSRLAGAADLDEYLGSFEEQLPLARQYGIKYFLADHRAVSGAEDFPSADIARLAAWFGRHRDVLEGACIAIVVNDPLYYGLTRMWEGHVTLANVAVSVEILPTVEGAEDWLSGETRA